MQTRNRRTWILSILSLVGFFAAVWVVAKSKPPQLLDRATKLADADKLFLDSSLASNSTIPFRGSYWWTSDHELLFFRNESVTVDPTRMNSANTIRSAMMGRIATPALYDVRSHSFRNLDNLAGVFKRSIGRTEIPTQVSPDGKRLLLSSFVRPRHHVAFLDGTAHKAWDSDGYAFLSRDGQVYDRTEHPVTDKLLSLTNIDTGSKLPVSHIQNAHWIVSDRVLWMTLPPRNGNRQSVSEIPLSESKLNGDKSVSTHIIRFPRKFLMYMAVLSPTGDRIAFALLENEPPATRKWLNDILPGLFPLNPFTITSLWVCRTDGTKLHEVGEVYRKDANLGLEPQLLRWVPGGKALSFVSGNGLWSVPAE